MELQGAGNSEEQHLGESGRQQVSLQRTVARGGVSVDSSCRGRAGRAEGTRWPKHE